MCERAQYLGDEHKMCEAISSFPTHSGREIRIKFDGNTRVPLSAKARRRQQRTGDTGKEIDAMRSSSERLRQESHTRSNALHGEGGLKALAPTHNHTKRTSKSGMKLHHEPQKHGAGEVSGR